MWCDSLPGSLSQQSVHRLLFLLGAVRSTALEHADNICSPVLTIVAGRSNYSAKDNKRTQQLI